MSYPTTDDLRDFVYREARMLDECAYERWLALFTEDAFYWMPLEPGSTDPHLVTSLLYEDQFLLRLRVERLSGERTYSQHPQSRCHHLLQRPDVDAADSDDDEVYKTTTAFHYVETRQDDQHLYAGWVRHELVVIDGELRIRLKRVDLVNSDAAFGNIQLFM
jgi:3-phenylpropionate/cinnamic acid dioxygenase small subunit